MLLVGISTIAAYVVLVLLAEALIWRMQPSMDGGVTLVIPGEGKERIERTVYGYEHDGTLYVSSNHWFRSWYHAALKDSDIEVIREGLAETQRYTANVVVGEERDQVIEGYSMGFFLRVLCGFAPRRLLRLEPVG